MPLQQEQIERWETLLADMRSDEAFMQQYAEAQAQREVAVQQINQLLNAYLSGQIDNETFRAKFQVGAAKAWRSFGLSGFLARCF